MVSSLIQQIDTDNRVPFHRIHWTVISLSSTYMFGCWKRTKKVRKKLWYVERRCFFVRLSFLTEFSTRR